MSYGSTLYTGWDGSAGGSWGGGGGNDDDTPAPADLPATPQGGPTPGMRVARRRQNQMYARALRLLQGSGRSQIRGAKQDMRQDLARSQQSLTSRGLGNTTIVGAEARGIRSDARGQMDSIRQAVAQQRANVHLSQAGGDLSLAGMGIQNNMNLQQQYIQLLQQLGQAGGSL